MNQTGSLHDLTDDELAAIARRAFARAAREARAAALTPSGVKPASRAGRKAANQQPITTPRRLKAAARGA